MATCKVASASRLIPSKACVLFSLYSTQVEIMMALEEKFEITLDEEGELCSCCCCCCCLSCRPIKHRQQSVPSLARVACDMWALLFLPWYKGGFSAP